MWHDAKDDITALSVPSNYYLPEVQSSPFLPIMARIFDYAEPASLRVSA